MRSHPTRSLLATILLVAAAQAGAVTIDFDDLPAGTILSDQYAGLGATFSAIGYSGAGGPYGDWATNTDMTLVDSAGPNVGASLGTPSLVGGRLLHSYDGWVVEDGDPSFTVSFSSPVVSFSADFAGVNEPQNVHLYAYDGATLVATATGSGSNLGTMQFTLATSAAAITRVVVTPGSFTEWVGVDNIRYTPAAVPEAGTCALMALGMAMLAFGRLRRPR